MITATLLEGTTIIVLDNVDDAIKSPSLAAALTSDIWSDRILGRSEVSALPNRATWLATGNNLQVAGDLARRCYRIRLDAKQAKPYTRTGFRHEDLEHWTHQHRGDILAALLTLARAWYAAGQPRADVPALGGYTPWARTVGGILHHAGIPGFLDNLHEFMATADQEANEWEGFLTAWVDRWGTEVVTVSEVLLELDSRGTVRLRDALPSDLAIAFERATFKQVLGMALTKRAGRHYGDAGHHLISHPKDRRRVALWSVSYRGADQPDADVLPLREPVRPPRDGLDFETVSPQELQY